MLGSRVPARARRARRRVAVRWCRHETSQPRPRRMGNDQSRMSPSPEPIASTGAPVAAGRRRPRRGSRRDAGGRSTIARPIRAQARPRPDGRSPRSAPWRAGSASHLNRPPSRRSGRPRGLPGDHRGACGSGSPRSRLTAARPEQGRRGAHIAVPSRLGLRPPLPGPSSGRGPWHPPFSVTEMPGALRSIILLVNTGGLAGGNRQREHGPSPEPITRRQK
jgi:hypothetical protein